MLLNNEEIFAQNAPKFPKALMRSDLEFSEWSGGH